MPGENRFRIFGNVPPGPEGPSAEYSEPSHEEFQAMLDERLPFAAKVVKEYWVTRYRVHRRSVPRYRDGRSSWPATPHTCTVPRGAKA